MYVSYGGLNCLNRFSGKHKRHSYLLFIFTSKNISQRIMFNNTFLLKVYDI